MADSLAIQVVRCPFPWVGGPGGCSVIFILCHRSFNDLKPGQGVSMLWYDSMCISSR